MAGDGETARVIDLGEAFGDVAVRANGVRVEIKSGGAVTLHTNGAVTLCPAVSGKAAASASTTPQGGEKRGGAAVDGSTAPITATVTKQAYNIGDVLPDGWIVGPVSPDTGLVIAIEPESGAPDGYATWHQGQNHAAELRGKGHANARQPSENELNAIYNDLVKAGRNGNAQFNISGSDLGCGYWASTTGPLGWGRARIQCFNDGFQSCGYKNGAHARARCVRDEVRLKLA